MQAVASETFVSMARGGAFMRFLLGFLFAGVALAVANPSAAQQRPDVYISGAGTTNRVNLFKVIAKINSNGTASGHVFLTDAPGASTSHLVVTCGKQFDNKTAILGGVLQLTQATQIFAFIGVRDTSFGGGSGSDFRSEDEISDKFFLTVNPNIHPSLQCQVVQHPLAMVKVVSGAIIFGATLNRDPLPR